MKKLHDNQLIGQEGVHLFSARILASGLAFHPTGTLDAGIDGFIELRDPKTGEVKAQYIAAQIKTVSALSEDNGETFSYKATDRDMDYWFNSNTPVILIVVHRDSQLICWKSIQSYFQDPERKRSRKVIFLRKDDELTDISIARLAGLVAGFAKPGVVTPSMRVEEELQTNLLKASFPYHLNLATTELSPQEIRQALLDRRDYPPIDWIVHDGRVVTFRDLNDPIFEEACDQGSIDPIETARWCEADGEVTKRLFVQFLGRCLGERLRERLVFERSRRYYFFKSNRQKRGERIYTFRDAQGDGKRRVVSTHGANKAGTGAAYLRHAAFYPRFIEIAGDWYLAVEPTYHFTRDGFEEYAFASDRLATIKTYGTNSNVRGHLRMWRALLTEEGDMIHNEYAFLSFEAVESLRHLYGVPDELWTSREDDEIAKARKAGQHELDL